ncbi:BTAD domain-containing putative transcriptional regulator [Streptomyces goshikiensis]|uniref:AfsR/SARP family transcriptional regulator n=1 Tax=Streptomyces goshikiensis TaxID=1942 RepID=UPI00367EC112
MGGGGAGATSHGSAHIPGGSVEFGVLGPLLVRDRDAVIPLPAAKQRTVLAVLLLRAGRVVGLDELAEFVWDGAPISGARGALLNHVMRLRQALGPDARKLIRTQGPGYLIDTEGHTFDLHVFNERFSQGRTAAAAGQWEQASRQLGAALDLWRGKPLLDVPSSALLRDEGQHLEEARLLALQARIEADLQLGQHETLVAELQQLVAEHPLRENLRSHLMLALYRAGRQVEALAAYRTVRLLLREELGVEPGSALQRLHQAILNADPELSPPPPAPPSVTRLVPPPAPAALAQVPAGISDFTGRQTLLTALCDLLSTPVDAGQGHAVVISAVSGTGGIGKTTLAVRAAHQVHEHFPDGGLYVNLRGAHETPLDTFDVLGRFLRDLGIHPSAVPGHREERIGLYRTLVAGRRLLILLDDARDAEQVRDLVPGRGTSSILITSRNTLTSLAGASHVRLEGLPPDDAHALFVRIVGHDRAAAEPAATSEVLVACAGLPLAIRIAASRLVSRPNWTIRYLADRLTDQRRRLDELQAGDLAVRASFRMSYAALTAKRTSGAARAFRLLGLVSGSSIDLPAAAALLGAAQHEAEEDLEALVDAHLLESPAPGRYRFHDLLRVYAAEVAEEEPQERRRDAVRRLLDWYLHTTVAAARALAPERRRVDPGPWQQELSRPLAFSTYDLALDWCESERANLVAASRQAADWDMHDIAWKLPGTLQRLFNIRKYWSDWVTTHELAARSTRRVNDRFGEGWILSNLGLAHLELRQFERALPYLHDALRIRREIGDRSGEGATLGSMGLALARRDRHEEAADYYRQSIAIHRTLEDRFNESIELNNLADTYRNLADFPEAIVCAERSLALSREIGDLYVEGLALSTIGETYQDLKEPVEAIRYCEESLALFRRIRHRQLEAAQYQRLGELRLELGEPDAARENWERALHILEAMGDRRSADVATRIMRLTS